LSSRWETESAFAGSFALPFAKATGWRAVLVAGGFLGESPSSLRDFVGLRPGEPSARGGRRLADGRGLASIPKSRAQKKIFGSIRLRSGQVFECSSGYAVEAGGWMAISESSLVNSE